MPGMSSKGMNTIDMMSYGWGEQPVRLWALSLKFGRKREHSLRMTD